MGDTKFGFYAYVDTPKKVQNIDIVSIGILGQISKKETYPPNTSTDLQRILKWGEGKIQFNFLWTPYIDKTKNINQGDLFRGLSTQDTCRIEMRVNMWDAQKNRLPTLYWNFYDVQVLRTIQNGKDEEVQTRYRMFDTGSNQLQTPP